MKITVYTVSDCKFSASEKAYLQSKNLAFEEKNLETNKENLTEMLNVSNNFAGTPVTKIEKDDGQILVLKGFTQTEFDNALGFSSPTPTAQAEPTPEPSMDTNEPISVPPVTPEPVPPVATQTTTIESPESQPIEVAPVAPPPGTNEGLAQDMGRDSDVTNLSTPVPGANNQAGMGTIPQPPAPTTADLNSSLNTVLNDLQAKSEVTPNPQPTPNTVPPSPSQSPTPQT